MKNKRFFEISNLYSNSFSIILGILFLFPTTFFAKNKKEQIKSLASNNESLGLLSIEKGVFEKEKDKLDREIQGLEIGNKKSLCEIAVLNLENNVFKQGNLNISKIIELFKDSILVSQEFKQILSFKEEHVIEETASFSHEFSLLQISSKELRGFVGMSSMYYMGTYFISGKLLNDKYIGDAFLIGCETTDCITPAGKFEIKINKQTIELTSDFGFNLFDIPIYNGLQIFEGDINLKSEPNKNSNTLLSLINETGKTNAEIKEIGPFENGNLWYKVKINNVEGWMFGGLCDMCFF